MVIKCTYVDQASQVNNYLWFRGVDTTRYEQDYVTYITVSGKLSPKFVRSFYQWIGEEKLDVEIQDG